MKRVLTINVEECRGCRICELICSFTKDGEFNPNRSRIRVVRNEWEGLYAPVVCVQCSPPICGSVCPTQAITREGRTGAIIVNQDKCTHCKLCVRACPIGAIGITRKNEPYVCDLCGGKPRCVEWCPIPGVIRYDSPSLEDRRKLIDHLLGLIKKTGDRPTLGKA